MKVILQNVEVVKAEIINIDADIKNHILLTCIVKNENGKEVIYLKDNNINNLQKYKNNTTGVMTISIDIDNDMRILKKIETVGFKSIH